MGISGWRWVGLWLSVVPVLAGGAFCAWRYEWEPVAWPAAPASLWCAKRRPESPEQRQRRLAKLRHDLRQIASSWVRAARQHETADFAWPRSLTGYFAPDGRPPLHGAPEGFEPLTVEVAGGAAGLRFHGHFDHCPVLSEPAQPTVAALPCGDVWVGPVHYMADVYVVRVTVSAGVGGEARQASQWYGQTWLWGAPPPSGNNYDAGWVGPGCARLSTRP